MSKEKQNAVSPVALFEGCTGVKTAETAEVSIHDSLPYLTFPNKRTKIWDLLAARIPGLSSGSPVLITRSSEKVKIEGEKGPEEVAGVAAAEVVSPVRYVLLDALQYWADKTDDGSAKNVTFSNPGFKSDKMEWVIGTLLLLHKGTVVPATLKVKGALCQAFRSTVKQNKEVNSDAWFGQSPAHKFTANIPFDCLRSVSTLTVYKQTAKSGKFAGKPYDVTKADIHPTSEADAVLLANFLKSDGWKKDAEAKFREALAGRVAEVKKASSAA